MGFEIFHLQSDTRSVTSVDMVFLDGAHDYDSVMADVTYWLPRTQKLLCGHDYHHEMYPDVTLVVDELLHDHLELVEGTGIWVYRP